MRVNHAGEIAAQGALPRPGPGRPRPSPSVPCWNRPVGRKSDHLAWCEQRLRELQDRPSLLAPLWYAGSFAIGVAAGLASDKVSLGFVAETERQVERHLDSHLDQLPPEDARSRAILMQMRSDEQAHGELARQAGGAFPARSPPARRCS